MASLYWRVKKNGKWTWTPAKMVYGDIDYLNHQIHVLIDLSEDVFEELKEEEE